MTPAWLHATLASGAGFAALFGAVALVSPQPRIVWNASPSMPLGLYRIHVGARPLAGDLVLIDPPEEVARLIAARAYLPHGVPLLKRVAAAEGALICRTGDFVTIDGAGAARARTRDRAGRTLPLWLGCRRLARGEIFVLGTAPASFDGRYFGPLPGAAVIGTAQPLLTRDVPGAPLRWRRGAALTAPPSNEKEPKS